MFGEKNCKDPPLCNFFLRTRNFEFLIVKLKQKLKIFLPKMAKKDKNILKDFTWKKIFDPKIAIFGPKNESRFWLFKSKIKMDIFKFYLKLLIKV